MAQVHFNTVIRGIKVIVASKKAGFGPGDIDGDQVLRDPPLRFAAAGIRALAADLNTAFGAFGVAITPNELVAPANGIQSVRSLWRFVWGKIPTANRLPFR